MSRLLSNPTWFPCAKGGWAGQRAAKESALALSRMPGSCMLPQHRFLQHSHSLLLAQGGQSCHSQPG